MFRRIYRKLLHALDNHGLVGTVRRLLRRTSVSAVSPQAEGREERPHPFDVAHGTDTSGYIPGEALESNSASDLYNTAYYGISPSTLRQAIAALPVDVAAYTFVDLGCGKGRALVVAAQAGFGKIAGVEISDGLAAVAQANCGAYANVSVSTGDAASVQFPDGPLVVFYYHPFLAPVLRKVLTNLLRQTSGGDVYVLNANPVYPKVYARFPQLEQQWSIEFSLSAEDAAADRHGITAERYTLWQVAARS